MTDLLPARYLGKPVGMSAGRGGTDARSVCGAEAALPDDVSADTTLWTAQHEHSVPAVGDEHVADRGVLDAVFRAVAAETDPGACAHAHDVAAEEVAVPARIQPRPVGITRMRADVVEHTVVLGRLLDVDALGGIGGDRVVAHDVVVGGIGNGRRVAVELVGIGADVDALAVVLVPLEIEPGQAAVVDRVVGDDDVPGEVLDPDALSDRLRLRFATKTSSRFAAAASAAAPTRGPRPSRAPLR